MSVFAYEDLWRIENDVETEFLRILSDCVDEGHIFASCSPFGDTETPWLEVTFLVGNVNPRHQKLYSNGATFYDAWSGSQLEIKVTTHRANNFGEHKIIIARARARLQLAMLASAGVWQSEIHSITDIREGGTIRSVDSDNDLDMSQVTFTVTHNIKPSAWPPLDSPVIEGSYYRRTSGAFLYRRPDGSSLYLRP